MVVLFELDLLISVSILLCFSVKFILCIMVLGDLSGLMFMCNWFIFMWFVIIYFLLNRLCCCVGCWLVSL